ncbi:trypsin-like serine protease [bacterium]|jgi:RNA-directed DNA polymerase|nr:trypsin-like serine protease [Deltaproteobacteria bacterium]MBT7087884.1 trypsin-like serine protease [bacterium]
MPEKSFLSVKSPKELSLYFNLEYAAFSKIFYKTASDYKYKKFYLSKKTGGKRIISSPNRKIKEIQRCLAYTLKNIYQVRPSVHGFVEKHSIVTNAMPHLDKKFVLNLDIKNFFDSIHFGRVKHLFMSQPFNFVHSVATVLAQICCFENKLPQGAPTSPILTNMICWKMDAQLQHLAKINHCTYTRYVDDITFSFTCNKKQIPKSILIQPESELVVGQDLKIIIEKNGFEINLAKLRLYGRNQRMEVTGLTTNEFPNVRRKYIKQIQSMLHAWRKYGYGLAEKDFKEKYYKKHRASQKIPSFENVIIGKLAFLKSVRGLRSQVFIKLAKQFNDLTESGKMKFNYIEKTKDETDISNSLWVIEVLYNDKNGILKAGQGTGFYFENKGLITCAHVVSENDENFEKINAFQFDKPSKKYLLKIKKIDNHRDIALCEFSDCTMNDIQINKLDSITVSNDQISQFLEVKLFGFPAYKIGQTPYIADAKIATIYTQSAVSKFEIDHQIREGNSGGPILNKDNKLIGVALEGAEKGSGSNGCLQLDEIVKFIN